jgi:hypothetical protein
MTLELSQLTLNRAVFEIRYSHAVLLWDRTGRIFAEIRKLYPAIEFKNITPNQQAVRLTPDLELSIGIDRAHVVSAPRGSDLSVLQKATTAIFAILIEHLELQNLTRLGLRVFYEKAFESKEARSAFVVNNAPFLQRSGKAFGIEGKVLDPEVVLRWENETVGCHVRFQSVGTKFEVEIPLQVQNVEPISTTNEIALVDVDYYAHAVTPVDRFNSSTLIENWLRLIRRDVGAFIYG